MGITGQANRETAEIHPIETLGSGGGMAGVGHEDQFPSTRLSAGYGFRKETIPGVRHKGRDANR
jgi:hypothetical protein